MPAKRRSFFKVDCKYFGKEIAGNRIEWHMRENVPKHEKNY